VGSEKLDLIYDIVKDIDKKQDTQNDRLSKLEVNVDRNTSDLTDHIEGVKQTRELIALNKQERNTKCSEMKHQIDKRLNKMQEPKLVIKTLAKWTVGIGGVAGAIFAIWRLVNKF